MSANDKTQSTTMPDITAHFEGIQDRGAERKVAIAVNVNFELKDGNRERGHAAPLHVIPLMRRAHPDGVVKVLAAWPRNVFRTREMTQTELKTELEGLMRSYGQKKPGQVASILAEVYGATEADQLRNLHAKMREVYHAWLELEKVARTRVEAKYPGKVFNDYTMTGLIAEVITDDEMAKLVHLIEPEQEDLEEIQLPDLETVTAAKEGAGDEQAQTEGDLIDWLTTELEGQLKLNQQDALELTAMVIEAGDGDIGADRLAFIKGMQKADGTAHGNKVKAFGLILAKYREKSAKPAPV